MANETPMTPESMWQMDLRRGTFLTYPYFKELVRFQGAHALATMKGCAEALTRELDRREDTTIDQGGEF